MNQTLERPCPNCGGSLECLAQSRWMMSLCRQCGSLWLEGDNLAQTIQQLHLTHLDSDLAFSELGTILRRGMPGSVYLTQGGIQK